MKQTCLTLNLRMVISICLIIIFYLQKISNYKEFNFIKLY
jgi:hypothetical protein